MAIDYRSFGKLENWLYHVAISTLKNKVCSSPFESIIRNMHVPVLNHCILCNKMDVVLKIKKK